MCYAGIFSTNTKFCVLSNIFLLPPGKADPMSDPIQWPGGVRALYLFPALIAFSDSWRL